MAASHVLSDASIDTLIREQKYADLLMHCQNVELVRAKNLHLNLYSRLQTLHRSPNL